MKKVVLILFLCSSILSSEFKVIEDKKNVELSQKDVIIQSYSGFAVTEDNLIILCDGKAGNFKIYDMKGDLKKVFGRKGYGPKEFQRPFLHDYYDHTMIIANKGTSRIKVLKRKKQMDFIEKHEFVNYSFDAKFMRGTLLYSSTPQANDSGESHTLFSINVKTKKKHYLMPFELIFGPKRLKIEKNLIGRDIPDELILGLFTYCDFYNDQIYYIWCGNLSIMRINPNKSSIFRFTKNTKNYFRPYASVQFKKAYNERNFKQYRRIKEKMSWVTGIFAEKRFVGIIYGNFDPELSLWKKFLQLYKRNGTFILEKPLKGFLSEYNIKSFYYDKKKRILYGISDIIDDDENDVYTLSSYKIMQ